VAQRRSAPDTLATRAARTPGLATRGFFGLMRSIQTQANPLSLPLFITEKAKWSFPSSVSGNASAMRRTSACVAILSS
jgi:hypothetical protein